MKWLPHHRFEIVSPLARQAAFEAMKAHVEPENWFRIGWPNSANDKRFEGTISGDGFHVRRVIGYRNSFLPVIDATFHPGASGTRIQVQMRMFIFVYGFCAIWLTAMISTVFASEGPFRLLAIGMIAFLYIMTMLGFWIEAGKQERTLRDIFKAT
jgi:hypothetical protein